MLCTVLLHGTCYADIHALMRRENVIRNREYVMSHARIFVSFITAILMEGQTGGTTGSGRREAFLLQLLISRIESLGRLKMLRIKPTV